jgi:DNA-binding MarR family transcriptional regulator
MDTLKEAIHYLSDLIENVLNETLKKYDFMDLTQQQLHYLQVIIRMKNPTLSELARELSLTRPTVTVLVDKLVEKGYVKRVKSDEDRRSMHLHIDKKGAGIELLRDTAYERLADKINARLNEKEAGTLTGLLRKITSES